MEFNTREFEFAHGHKPRGTGGWAFAASRNATPEKVFWAHGTFSEAKAQARKHFAAQPNVFQVWVLS